MSDDKKHGDSHQRSQMQGFGGDDDFDSSGNPLSEMQTSGGITSGLSLQEALPSNTSTENLANSEADVPTHQRETLKILLMNKYKRDVPSEGYQLGGYCAMKAGDTVNSDYDIIKKLGEGTYSTVWMAWNSTERKYVALKIARGAEYFRVKAETELVILQYCSLVKPGAIGADNIVRILTSFTHTSVTGNHLVLSFDLHGPTLYNVLHQSNQRLMNLDIVRRVTSQLLAAVDYLHVECGIIHSDIKSENIMIAVGEGDVLRMDPSHPGYEKSTQYFNLDLTDPKSNIKIILGDFGLSCFSENPIRPLLQTCAYQAPEVFHKEDAGTAVDMWSVGCVVYELVTSRILFSCFHTKNEKKKVHIGQMPEIAGGIPFGPNNEEQISSIQFDRRLLFHRIRGFRKMHKEHAELCEEFILSLLKREPSERMDTYDALYHPFLIPSDGDERPPGSDIEDLADNHQNGRQEGADASSANSIGTTDGNAPELQPTGATDGSAPISNPLLLAQETEQNSGSESLVITVIEVTTAYKLSQVKTPEDKSSDIWAWFAGNSANVTDD